MSRPVITGSNPNYNKVSNGSAQSAVLVRGNGDNVDASNILARISSVNWNIPYSISDVPEINQRESAETVYGRAGLVSGQIGMIQTLKNNDQLTSSETLIEDEEEMTLFILSGDDHALTTNTGGTTKRVASDVFIGFKISGKAGGVSVNQLRMTSVNWIARKHYTGAQWKRRNASASYPVDVA